jgi:tricarballylate dehydrogenase
MPISAAPKLGVEIRYESPVDKLEIENGRFQAAWSKGQRITAKSCVLAAGGFESNREWLREAWGQNERGEWPADNFIIRGTAFNQGVLLKHMLEEQQADGLGDPRRRTWWPSMPAPRCTTAASARASTASRWAWW